MKIPKNIKIYGKNWAIDYKWNLKDDEGNNLEGLCCFEKRLITIDRLLTKEKKFSVFLHELFHAILFELKIKQTSLSSDVEEIIVEGFADFLTSNFDIRSKKKSTCENI